MRTTWTVLMVIVCMTIQGCNKSQKVPLETKSSPKMKYDIVDRNAFTVMGILTRVKPEEETSEKYAEIWKKFENYTDQIRPLSVGWRCYGIDFPTKKEKVFDYLAGMAVQSDVVVPDPNLVTREVPAARYAIFKCPYQEIGQTYQEIFSNWLPNSRYKIDASACSFEQYSLRDREDRPVSIHIPIKNK